VSSRICPCHERFCGMQYVRTVDASFGNTAIAYTLGAILPPNLAYIRMYEEIEARIARVVSLFFQPLVSCIPYVP
jgi:hypothetical protein